MRVVSNLTIIFYSIFFFIIGALLVLITVNVVPKDAVCYTVEMLYSHPNMRLVGGITGGLIIFVTILVIQIIIGKMQMERTIAFDNPDGQVTISLSAIEDFVKRLTKHLPEIKDLKPDVIATKKGLSVTTRLILYSDTNIPEITERIQNMIKGRVQEILGIEESVVIKVHIAKIVPKEEPREARTKEKSATDYRGIEY